MRKEKIGARKNFWTIMYADDKVLLAKNEQKLKEDVEYGDYSRKIFTEGCSRR